MKKQNKQEDGENIGKYLSNEIILARQCMRFKSIDCRNKDCKNVFCPLNKYWENEKTK